MVSPTPAAQLTPEQAAGILETARRLHEAYADAFRQLAEVVNAAARNLAPLLDAMRAAQTPPRRRHVPPFWTDNPTTSRRT